MSAHTAKSIMRLVKEGAHKLATPANAARIEAAVREVCEERDDALAALSRVSFYARVNHGTKCKDYGEIADAVLENTGVPTGELLHSSNISKVRK